MKLLDYCKTCKGEIEVWDEQVDICAPYYNYDGEACFANNEEDQYLFLAERWFLSLDVKPIRAGVCSVDCFQAIDERWDDILCYMIASGAYGSFLNRFKDHHDDEMIAEFVEDVFTCLSQGYYGFAQDFCCMLDLSREYESAIAARCEAGEYKVVPLDSYPDPDIFYYRLSDLDWDGSQGTGNLVYKYFYFPDTDTVGCFADF